MKNVLVVLVLQVLIASLAWALPPGTVKLSSSRVFQTTTSEGKFVCGKMSNGKWVPGIFVNKKALLFQPLSAKVKQITSKMASAADHELPAMQLQLSSFQGKLSAGKLVCKSGKPKSGGGGSSPSPTPTPPPTGSSGCFDSSGSVTSAGKAKFGIPSSLSASISAGKSAVQAMCSGCHSDELGKSFGQYRTAIAVDPMFYDEAQVPNSTLANITAYLNRFRTACN